MPPPLPTDYLPPAASRLTRRILLDGYLGSEAAEPSAPLEIDTTTRPGEGPGKHAGGIHEEEGAYMKRRGHTCSCAIQAQVNHMSRCRGEYAPVVGVCMGRRGGGRQIAEVESEKD